MPPVNKHYFAIDVGGSRIRGFDSLTKENYLGAGVRHTSTLTKDLAKSITDFFPKDIEQVDLLILSLAAIPQKENDLQLLASALYQKVIFEQLIIVSDTRAALASIEKLSDLVIAVGTGVTASVQTQNTNFNLSGLGYLIGDEGSGYWIGRHGLNAALKALEGSGENTTLTQSAISTFGIKPSEIADYVHQLENPVTKIAAFATEVEVCARDQDPIAISIIDSAAREITNLIKIAIKRVNIKTVSLVGGAIPSDSLLNKKVRANCEDLGITLIESKSEPLIGACKIAESTDLYPEIITIKSSEILPEIWSELLLLTSERLINQVAVSQKDTISQSVYLLTDAIANQKLVHTFGTGHSHLLAEEIFYRAGGLAAIYPILDERIMLHKDVVKGSQNERLPGLANELIKKHPINKGDVVIVISNSGGNQVSIDLIKLAHSSGAKVIALTSINHATSNTARSNSTEKIHQLADVVLDNAGIVGDAAIRVAGSKMAVGPTSTVVGSAILQAIIVGTVAELIKRGIDPEIFLSSNLAGGDENNAAIFAKYRPIINLYN